MKDELKEIIIKLSNEEAKYMQKKHFDETFDSMEHLAKGKVLELRKKKEMEYTFPQENWFYIKAGIVKFLLEANNTFFTLAFNKTRSACLCLYKDKELNTDSRREVAEALTADKESADDEREDSIVTRTPQELALVHDIHLFLVSTVSDPIVKPFQIRRPGD